MIRTIVAAALFLYSLAAVAFDESLLIGTWNMKTNGPSHATMKLNSDHTAATVVFLKKAFDKKQELWSGEGTWQLEGTALIVKYTKSKQGKIFDERHDITELSEGRLLLKSAKGEQVEYVQTP